MDWPALRAAQRRVLSSETTPAFRSTPAHTGKNGARHPWTPDMEARFRQKLQLDDRDDAPGVIRAVRGYLDVIFVHPFTDGNSRAARLMLEYGLRRHGLPTPDLEAFVRLPKHCGDRARYWGLCRMLAGGILREAGVCRGSIGAPGRATV